MHLPPRRRISIWVIKMNSSGYPIALLDANVLYPAPLRDFLLRLAQLNLFQPKWTTEIHEEWTRNLLKNRPDLKPHQLQRTCRLMDEAFTNALVTGYKSIISSLDLPDENDRHVLAAAIKCGATIIVTENRKDFPAKILKPFDIESINADDFIYSLFNSDKTKVLQAFDTLVNALKSPPQSKAQVSKTLSKIGLLKTMKAILE